MTNIETANDRAGQAGADARFRGADRSPRLDPAFMEIHAEGHVSARVNTMSITREWFAGYDFAVV